jgi:F1F0 ATPase subunit 2
LTEILTLWTPVFFAGVGIGLFYFGGLWWTVRLLPSSSKPTFWYLGSFLARTALSLPAFYWVMGGRWEKLLVSLLGFMAVRIWVVRRTRPGKRILRMEPQTQERKE